MSSRLHRVRPAEAPRGVGMTGHPEQHAVMPRRGPRNGATHALSSPGRRVAGSLSEGHSDSVGKQDEGRHRGKT